MKKLYLAFCFVVIPNTAFAELNPVVIDGIGGIQNMVYIFLSITVGFMLMSLIIVRSLPIKSKTMKKAMISVFNFTGLVIAAYVAKNYIA